jgi:hypothetical protein
MHAKISRAGILGSLKGQGWERRKRAEKAIRVEMKRAAFDARFHFMCCADALVLAPLGSRN